MSGTKKGGKKAGNTNKKKYGKNFYAEIGAKGGKLGKTGGFYGNSERARIAGAKGGKISRRGPGKTKVAPKPIEPTLLERLKKAFRGDR
jgi:general stress protein YciG